MYQAIVDPEQRQDDGRISGSKHLFVRKRKKEMAFRALASLV